jgi:hypothetical protein
VFEVSVEVSGEQASALTTARNADGGWPYFRGGRSRLEPTCFALVALAAAGVPTDTELLGRWPKRDGLLVDPAADIPNHADNALAILALLHRPTSRTTGTAVSLASALGAVKGRVLPPSEVNRQDNAIQGWPWLPDTFSWVEPTAWCALALKKGMRAHHDPQLKDRAGEGERLLIDRVCRNGGWNYGNSNMFGAELFPYVSTTAIALLALQDRHDHPAVQKSIAYLTAHSADERSGLSLSLSRIALSIHAAAGADSPESLDSDLDDTWQATQFLGNLAVTALALYARTGRAEGYRAFRIA